MPEYRIVEGHPDYRAGDDGSVWSKRMSGDWRKMSDKPSSKRGYVLITLMGEGGPLKIGAHILVARAFMGPQPPGHEVCHKDGVKHHNWKTNLRWGTRSSNVLDRIQHGTHNRGTDHVLSVLTEDQVRNIWESRCRGEGCTTIAERNGTTASLVCSIYAGKAWKWLTDTLTPKPNDQKRTSHVRIKEGEVHFNAKLTGEQVRLIWGDLLTGMKVMATARKNGVSRSNVKAIHRGETWVHITKDLPPLPKIHRSQFTQEQVREMWLRRHAGEKYKTIAADYGVSEGHVCDIYGGSCMGHLTADLRAAAEAGLPLPPV